MSTSPYRNDPRYRPCVGIGLFNGRGQVFIGQRLDNKLEAWQMPQGGIDPGETPEQAAFRELREETGTDKAVLFAEVPGWHRYDLPPEWQGKLWGGNYIGQQQKWFMLRLTGSDEDIDINTPDPEFRCWRWADLDEVPGLVVPFKRDLYVTVIAEMKERIASGGSAVT